MYYRFSLYHISFSNIFSNSLILSLISAAFSKFNSFAYVIISSVSLDITFSISSSVDISYSNFSSYNFPYRYKLSNIFLNSLWYYIMFLIVFFLDCSSSIRLIHSGKHRICNLISIHYNSTITISCSSSV